MPEDNRFLGSSSEPAEQPTIRHPSIHWAMLKMHIIYMNKWITDAAGSQSVSFVFGRYLSISQPSIQWTNKDYIHNNNADDSDDDVDTSDVYAGGDMKHKSSRQVPMSVTIVPITISYIRVESPDGSLNINFSRLWLKCSRLISEVVNYSYIK